MLFVIVLQRPQYRAGLIIEPFALRTACVLKIDKAQPDSALLTAYVNVRRFGAGNLGDAAGGQGRAHQCPSPRRICSRSK